MDNTAHDRAAPPGGGGDDWVEAVAEALTGPGWWVDPAALPAPLWQALALDLERLRGLDGLQAARIGPAGGRQRLTRVRGDHIHWLDGDSAAQAAYLALLEQLRLGLNRRLFLGLEELEAHYALYPPGARYARHLDAFQGDNLRRVSVVTYLNPDWAAGDGGELLIHRGGRVIAAFPPRAGTLAVFLSETIPHEVRPARRERRSIAGWFRVRPLEPRGQAGRAPTV